MVLATRENRHVVMVFGAPDGAHDNARVALVCDHVDLAGLTGGQVRQQFFNTVTFLLARLQVSYI